MPNINKNIIMQAGAAVANATNKAAGLSAATPEPGSIISVIQLVNGGRTIGPDALAHFTESVRNKLLSLLVSMEPIQDCNGYGHPWPAGGGINKADYPAMITQGAVEQADDSLYVAASSTLSNFVIYQNDGTAGQFTITFTSKNPSTTRGLYPRVKYTDGTMENMNVTGHDTYGTATLTTNSSKTVDSIFFVYGSNVATWFYVQVESGATAHDWTPYANICPISGRTGLHVYAGPTSAIGDAATYSMAWTSPAGTVYAGSADIVTGDIKEAPYYASYNGETLVGPWVSSMEVYDSEGTPTTGAQVVDLGGTMTEYHITGQDIITLVGDNYIWSDSGDVTIKE